MTHKLQYRPDIDGLRAIAVMGVFLYHLGFSYLPGGFVGVDIFFVISGFLISRVIYSETFSGSFSVKIFYERRARRILPAFFVVTTLTFFGVYYLFLPNDFYEFSKSVLASIFMVPNIYFYITTDYFAPAANTIPLLHYWSLGVEEQFYLFFPVIIILVLRLSRRHLAVVVVGLALISLAASEIVVRTNPPAAFYLLPFRAFELLIGSIIALPAIQGPTNHRVGTVASGIGFFLIIFALLRFTHETRFPGVSALIPTVGAGLVLWGCERYSNPFSRLLSSPIVVFIGKISYSLYLIHWPTILFFNRALPYLDPLVRGVSVLAISIALATASYFLVEQPFRRKPNRLSRNSVFALSCASIAALTCGALIVMVFSGFPGRLDSRVAQILAYQKYDLKPQFRSGVCFLNPEQIGSEINFDACLPKSDGKRAVLWGDSTAAHLYHGLREPLEQAGYRLGQLTASACPPAVGLDVAARPNCLSFNKIVFAKILEERPDLAILAAGWSVSPELLEKLDATIAALRAAGIRPVVLGTPPLYRIGVPALLAERLQQGNQSPFSGNDILADFTFINDEALVGHFQRKPEIRFVSIVKTLCPGKECPIVANDNAPMHFDPLHLTPAGSKFFARALLPEILRAN